ncbi:hypothetical protein DXG01_014782 [Tephrocybe rancida]|nr:hypothetical protein DXG01_014782 [Tephrocybe rancida]
MTGVADGSFFPTEEELGLVAQIYDQTGCSRPGYIEKEVVVEILTASVNLEPGVLSTIWDIADEAKSGYLSETGVAIALRLIGWARSGEEVTVDLVNKSGPLPQINHGATETDLDWPPFTEGERDASQKLFEECGPAYGLLEGDKARDAFLMFDLAPKDIWKIWEIADTRKRGALDRYDFALALYLIQGVQSGRLTSVPPTTPPKIYEQIRAVSVSPTIPTPVSPQLPDKPARPRRPTRPPPPPSVLPPEKLARSPTSATSVQTTVNLTPEQQFDLLDDSNVGYLETDVVAKFMLKFELAPEDLAQIWDPADLNKDGRLTRDEFVIAMQLIEQRLNGAELPHVLPTSMIPPSLRVRSPNTSLRRSVTSPNILKKSPTVTRSRNATINGRPILPPKPVSPPTNYRHSISISDNWAKPPKPILPRWGSRHSIAIPTVAENHTEQEERVPEPEPEPEPQVVALERYQTLEQANLRLSSQVEDLLAQIDALQDPFRESEHVSMEQYQALEQENYRLSSNLKELTSQINAQYDVHGLNDTLSRDNAKLLAKVLEMEQITSDVLQSNESAAEVRQLEANNAELSHHIAELEQLQPQLDDMSRRLDNALEDNRDLSTRLRDARDRADEEERLTAIEMDNMRKNMQLLGQDNQTLRVRADELQRTISQAPSTSSTNAQEMEILMADITRENEALKERQRQMEKSTANLLLSSSGHAEHEKLRRTNNRLTTQVQDFEQLIKELQRSSEEQELQRVLKDVTAENGQLKESLRDLRLEVTQLQQAARLVEPLQTKVEQLNAEVQRLHTVNVQAQTREDSSVLPPPYEADPFH